MAFTFSRRDAPAAKCDVSLGCLPQYIDPKQLPSKKKPFATILNQPFTHTVRSSCMQRYQILNLSDQVELLLPEELYDLIWKELEARLANIRYSHVVMSLSDLLEADFFNIYIKTGIFLILSSITPNLSQSIPRLTLVISDMIVGNVLMLSEGRPGVDNLYTLKDGMQISFFLVFLRTTLIW